MTTEYFFILPFVFLASILYYVLIFLFTKGWFKLKPFQVESTHFKTRISIIVAARNEENQIANLLQSIINQDYPKNLYELIIIDDASTDHTFKICEDILHKFPEFKGILLQTASNQEGGKKNAIKRGIDESNGDLIITTDADCLFTDQWLSTIACFYEKYLPELIINPVLINPTTSLFEKLQALEFTSLIASTAGATAMNFPIMANGANLAFTRRAYTNANLQTTKGYSSGDDMFLMHEVKQNFTAKSIFFLKNRNAAAYTSASKSFKDLANQRLRWVSKSPAYKDYSTIMSTIIIFLYNLIIVVSLLAGILLPELLWVSLILWVLKLFTDFPLLYSFNRYFNQRGIMWYYPLVQLLYPPYVVFTGIFGLLRKPFWKGRKIS